MGLVAFKVGTAWLLCPPVTTFLWRKPSVAAGSGDRTGSLLALELAAVVDVAPDSVPAFGDMVLLEPESPEFPLELKSL